MIRALRDANTEPELETSDSDRLDSDQPIYVPQEMFSKEGPVIITTKKLNVQLLACLSFILMLENHASSITDCGKCIGWASHT